MILNKDFSNVIFEYTNRTKQISKLGFNADDMDNYIHTLNEIASLDYDLNQINDYDLSRYLIPKSMRDMVIPRKVSYNVGVEFEDMRSDCYSKYDSDDAGFKNVKTLKPREFNEITAAIFGSRKLSKTDENTMNLLELSQATSLDAVANRTICDDKSYGPSDERFVAKTSNPIIPVQINFDIYTSKQTTNRLDGVLDDWLEIALNDLR